MRRYRNDGEPMSPEDFEKGINGQQEQDEDEVITETEEATDEDDLTPEDKIQMVRDRRDCRKDADDPETVEEAQEVIDEQDKDIQTLLDSIDEIQAQNDLTEKKEDEDDLPEETEDDEDDEELNKDSVDKRIQKRVSLLRTADKLNLDGVDNLSNLEIMKKVIKAVNPRVRLDGKSKGYINYAYQFAVENLVPKKDASYQRRQMMGGARADSADRAPSRAMTARERMIAREGGNK